MHKLVLKASSRVTFSNHFFGRNCPFLVPSGDKKTHFPFLVILPIQIGSKLGSPIQIGPSVVSPVLATQLVTPKSTKTNKLKLYYNNHYNLSALDLPFFYVAGKCYSF